MTTVCLNGIVTSYTDYKDHDRILTLFTAERGRVDCKARNCRKPTAPLLVCSQPFVYGEFELFLSHDRATVNACDVRESFYPLREDIDRFFVASAMTQLCNSVIMPDTPSEGLFSLLYHCLSFLAYAETDPDDLLCGFLLKYLDRTGYRPALTQCASCLRDVRADPVLFFSAERGGTVCAACAKGAPGVDRLTLEAMRRMLLLPDTELKKIVLPKTVQRETLHLLTDVLAEILGRNDRAIRTLEQRLDER